VKANGHHHNIYSEIWATNAFDGRQQYKKLDNSKLIAKLHVLKPKLLVEYLLEFLLQVVKKNNKLYPPIGVLINYFSLIYFLKIILIRLKKI
jgi:hypothetical protein